MILIRGDISPTAQTRKQSQANSIDNKYDRLRQADVRISAIGRVSASVRKEWASKAIDER